MNASQAYWHLKAVEALSRGLTEHEFIFTQSGWYEPVAREAYQAALKEEQMRQAAQSEVVEVKL